MILNERLWVHRHSLLVSWRVSAEAVTRLVHARGAETRILVSRTVSHVTDQRHERILVQHRALERLCSKFPRILLRISNKLLRDLCLQPDDARALSGRKNEFYFSGANIWSENSCRTLSILRWLPTDNMNIFRLSGDVCHLIAIIILFLKIWRSKSCAGTRNVICTAEWLQKYRCMWFSCSWAYYWVSWPWSGTGAGLL